MKKLTTEEFVYKSNQIHNFKYNYSLVKYKGNKIKVCIICPIHGQFLQTGGNHLSDRGCPECKKISISNKNLPTLSQFIEKAKLIHGNRYDYIKVKYKGNKIKVCIICPIHGQFLQTPNKHLIGQNCPKCQMSKGEISINNYLIKTGISYIPQYRFKDCRGKKKPLSFDFYLPELNTCIEFDGEQHYTNTFNGKIICNYDKIKDEYCKQNNIRLLRIPYWERQNIEKILLMLISSTFFVFL